ncbi:MAG: DUF3786 domain-containing protein [Paraclostridium sp.]
MGNSLNEGNYIIALKYIKEQFKKSNPYIISKLSNSNYDPESKTFNIKFINKNLKVKYPSGDIFYENLELFNDISSEILILRYLVNAKESSMSNTYITYKEIKGGYVYYPNFKSRTIKDFIYNYAKNLVNFKEKMELYNVEKLDFGDASYKVRFINDIHIVFILWEGDSEFEASGNILFESNINDYFDAEDIAVIPDILMRIL